MNVTVPVYGVNPVIASTNVVLPAPLGPINPTIWPGITRNEMWSLARRPP